MNIEATRNPAYLTRLSCLAAGLSKDPHAEDLVRTDNFSGAHCKSLDAEQKAMLQDLELLIQRTCPQQEASPDSVRAVLQQYAQVTGMIAAQMMLSPTTSLPFTAAMAQG